jgi:hypothetical protein
MTTKPHIIGLMGLAGVGKDTVRQILEEEHGYQGIAFADPIREMLTELLSMAGTDRAYMHRRDLKEATIPELGTSYRHLAQTLGTEWGRSISPDFWVRVTANRIGRMKPNICWVFSDVRFPNEVEFIRECLGVIWRIERAGIDPVRNHASETHAQTMPADRVIDNNGTLDDLWSTVDAIMNTTTQKP